MYIHQYRFVIKSTDLPEFKILMDTMVEYYKKAGAEDATVSEKTYDQNSVVVLIIQTNSKESYLELADKLAKDVSFENLWNKLYLIILKEKIVEQHLEV